MEQPSPDLDIITRVVDSLGALRRPRTRAEAERAAETAIAMLRRDAFIAGARETSQADALVYPLMLDLLVEHWRALLRGTPPGNRCTRFAQRPPAPNNS